MKKRMLFLFSLLLCALLLGCCKKSLDTKENQQIFVQDVMMTYTVQSWGTLYAGIETPWLAVREEKTDDQGAEYSILGVSEELSNEEFSRELLNQVNTVVICRVKETSAEYRSSDGVISRGTTEVAEIDYYRVDREKEELVLYAGGDQVSNALPEVSAKTPHLTVTDNQIAAAVKKRADSGISPLHPTDYIAVSPEGELNFLMSLKDRDEKIILPKTVKRIVKLSFSGGEKITIWVPASVEEIAPGNFGKMAGKTITLVVEPGSYAERYASENEIPYVYTEDFEP